MFGQAFLFLLELMVKHVYRRIQFGFMILMIGASFVVWVMLSSTCSDCDPVLLFYFDDGKFTTQCPVSWQRCHMTSGNDLP